jgi:hypothetical protein
MRIASGEDDDFAGFDHDRRFADDIGEAAAFGHHVIRDQVPGTRQDLRQDHVPRRLLGDPRFPGHDVEERGAGQPHRFQYVG